MLEERSNVEEESPASMSDWKDEGSRE
jgi:hypothetical protein